MAKKKAKPKTGGPATTSDESFEESLAELEAIVADLEGGELGLDEALARYEEGVTRLRNCHAQLDTAERRIELLSGFDADGNPVTTPYDAEATSDADNRSAKRTSVSERAKGRKAGGGVDDSTPLF
ncbi:exodeoxyribonuclease VII small subunit [Botrimarina hoheduenensis]|uniref:Exodeoxyribonuclease 7 small subunit n=1 Tax=Botrimarina hoheduenensis TaxID=2528000 RepID=A0A5C5VSI8_9BACT|nr:exodeoxyribonuclease VII small subunit [Botrimarina hoheduenensis]TWT41594.1 Exodeoxyribonuclease 7 small subunit [Botrimarina hoheduenensis]